MPLVISHESPVTIYLAGPTGVGKTALALALAKRMDAEIIGADAFQIYRGMPILTAQPSEEDRSRARHHLIGCVPPEETFDVNRYVAEATQAISDIHARSKAALVVGGTGLYFRGLVDGLAPTPPPDDELRREMGAMDLPGLVAWLTEIDPEAPAMIDGKNRRRVERAIEIVSRSGRPLREFRSSRRTVATGVLLVRDRAELVARIAANVHAMFESGVVGEVEALRENAGPTAEKAIGLREIRALLAGEISRAECEEKIVVATRQYAKRQLTWFRNQTTFRPLDLTGIQDPLEAAERAMEVLA